MIENKKKKIYNLYAMEKNPLRFIKKFMFTSIPSVACFSLSRYLSTNPLQNVIQYLSSHKLFSFLGEGKGDY